MITVLFIGDIVGEPGMEILSISLPILKRRFNPDFIIANGENMHEGRGYNFQQVQKLYEIGINVITGGNHSFDKHLIFNYMDLDKRLLRPINYPKGTPGKGYGVYTIPHSDIKIGVINAQGRTFMNTIDCPFKKIDLALQSIKKYTNTIIVDFHAEATSEKRALAWYLDGRVSALVGTHTHVPTADYQIMPMGMAYITDVGMTGSHNSVIGMNKESVIQRFILQTPQKFELAQDDLHINAVLIQIDEISGLSKKIEHITFPEFKRISTQEQNVQNQIENNEAHTLS
ncbi:MAG: TIGR00282 family metallophosphoesterase [Bacteroidia bacterium]|nr:TIGR00282 family metallophosphoesterase [Bacteroidia bacterium]MDW8346475.1 TIGR00282 family metallophosphoesterase [Bacteroidia bacterium]